MGAERGYSPGQQFKWRDRITAETHTTATIAAAPVQEACDKAVAAPAISTAVAAPAYRGKPLLPPLLMPPVLPRVPEFEVMPLITAAISLSQ